MSISSTEGSPAPADLHSKYQKLASEYAKARSQITVLKQAIRDEQVKSILQKDQLKTRDQELRKDSQELESLVFRNEQLTKRVTVLQDELDKLQSASRRGKTAPENNQVFEESKLFQEELQKTILQNAALLSKLEEKDLLMDHERFQAQIKIDELKKSLEEATSRLKVAVPVPEAALLNQKELNNSTGGDRPVPCIRCTSLEEKYIETLKKMEALEKSSMKTPPPQADKNSTEFPLPEGTSKVDRVLAPSSDSESISKSSKKYLEDLQNAESKFTRMQCEADAIRCRYEQAVEELNLKKQTVSQLEEELSVTTRNYEDQLGSMSEHMANMNDKLTAQQTMIEELTYELQSKDTKKSRGK